MAVELTAHDARRYLVGHHGLRLPLGEGADGTRALLSRLRCIQLDPLDPMGTNADLVAMARVDGLERGDVYRHLLPHHAFEHFAKERCLLPPSAFPQYRDQAAQTPWWRLTERLKRLPEELISQVLDEVAERGPVTPKQLTDRGRVDPIDWHGWKSTAKATSMALEVLWTRCRVVVCGRSSEGKLYDVPERALPDVATVDADSFGRWAVGERVEAAGLLSRSGGPHWSMLRDIRTSGLVDRLLEDRELLEVRVEGSTRTYLAPKDAFDRRFPDADDRLRILAPLDPLLWDRKLVHQAFGFEYIWEVYKPKAQRRWGWYVHPLMHQGELIGRLEGRVEGATLVIDRLWEERRNAIDPAALDEALEVHGAACGADWFVRPTRAERN